MPSSVNYFDSTFEYHLNQIKPNTILDVGIGAGKYGRLTKAKMPNCKITGIEAEKSYLSRFPDVINFYDDIVHKDIMSYIKEDMNDDKRFDLVVCGDVLEHLFISQVNDILSFFSYRCNWFIAQYPTNVAQHNKEGNDWEVHRSNLSIHDFTRYNIRNFRSMVDPNDVTKKVNHHYVLIQMN